VFVLALTSKSSAPRHPISPARGRRCRSTSRVRAIGIGVSGFGCALFISREMKAGGTEEVPEGRLKTTAEALVRRSRDRSAGPIERDSFRSIRRPWREARGE
jgi:hypothetical protein